ncbi:MAG: UDP-N-acetylglucosamine 1-carboxyvinyltransferase [Candidatus Nanosyncoccaceae bacterium]|jgi:UDP-N-acetylglucosamine 1-carboxyvinyltransferase
MAKNYKRLVGDLVQRARLQKNMTQADLAAKVNTSQSAINRIEKGKQNISLDMIERISSVLKVGLLTFGQKGVIHFRINGGKKLNGSIRINTSKNAAVGLLCASLLNRGKTVLRHVANIEEVYRIIEVIESLGVKVRWLNNHRDVEIIPPAKFTTGQINLVSARMTRSVIMLMGVLLHKTKRFKLPYAGGCNLGARTVEPHLKALESFGLKVNTTGGFYNAEVKAINPTKPIKIVLAERGDTVTENVLMAAALHSGVTEIRNASPNYMVQDVCFFLEKLGVRIEGIGTTVLRVQGLDDINKNVSYEISEDPIEAMSFIAAGLVTKSEITVKRAPIDFLEVEIETLRGMGANLKVSDVYFSRNERTKLVDIVVKPSQLTHAIDKVHPMPYPGLNIDNLPFFAIIAAVAEGPTMIHDWVYENRAIYLAELSKLNVSTQLIDPHRIIITGPTKFKSAEIVTPPALRPAVVLMLAMLAADGESTLRNVYSINRGYEDFARRLNSLGADIETIY